MNDTEFNHKLKAHIIEYLNLTGIKPENINDDEPLFGERLELDSIDSLELAVLLEREYGLKINNLTEGRKILATVNSIATFIKENKKQQLP